MKLRGRRSNFRTTPSTGWAESRLIRHAGPVEGCGGCKRPAGCGSSRAGWPVLPGPSRPGQRARSRPAACLLWRAPEPWQLKAEAGTRFTQEGLGACGAGPQLGGRAGHARGGEARRGMRQSSTKRCEIAASWLSRTSRLSPLTSRCCWISPGDCRAQVGNIAARPHLVDRAGQNGTGRGADPGQSSGGQVQLQSAAGN
jgi:hypothetical protein